VWGARSDAHPNRVEIESSIESEWATTWLEGLGHEVVVADPNFAAMYGTRTRLYARWRDGRDFDDTRVHLIVAA
jgi:hypothetical protein